MTEEFSFDIDEESIKQLESVIHKEIIKIRERFDNRTETLEDLLYQYPHIVLKCELKNKQELDLDVVERKYYERLAGRAKLQDTEINSLKETIQKQEKSREHLKKQLKGEIAVKDTEINKLNKELEEWQTAYQEEKDKQFDILAENIKLKEVIDRMGIFINSPFMIPEDCYCEFKNSNEDCCWKTDKECKDCIKEYFMKEDK